MTFRTTLSRSSIAILLALVSTSVAACSTSSLEQDCAAVRTELENIGAETRTSGDEYATWPSGYATTNAGRGSRSVAKQDIIKNFPFVPELVEAVKAVSDVNDLDQESYFGTRFRAVSTAYVLERVTQGASEPVTFSTVEMAKFANGQIGGIAEKQAFIDKCADNSDIGGTSSLFNDTVNAVNHAADTYLEIEFCTAFGEFDGTACADSDYSSGLGIDIFPENPRNPFVNKHSDPVVQGLAEIVWCVNQNQAVNEDRTGCE